MYIRLYSLVALFTLLLTACDEQTTCSETPEPVKCECPTQQELESLINERVESYVAEAIAPTINTAVANALKEALKKTEDNTKYGSRLSWHSSKTIKREMSDGTWITTFEGYSGYYDSTLETNCKMTNEYNNKYCCVPEFKHGLIWWHDFDENGEETGFHLHDLTDYNPDYKNYILFDQVNDYNKPCLNYNEHCTMLYHDKRLFCEIVFNNNEYSFDCQIIDLNNLDSTFVCEV